MNPGPANCGCGREDEHRKRFGSQERRRDYSTGCMRGLCRKLKRDPPGPGTS